MQPHYGVRTDRWKLIHFPAGDEWELYDLQQDPDEVRNLALEPEQASQVAQLQVELERLRSFYGVPDGS